MYCLLIDHGGYLPGGVPSGGVPAQEGCTCPEEVCTCRGVYLPRGYTCLGWVYLLGVCICSGMYLLRRFTCPEGVPAQGVYLPRGCTCQGEGCTYPGGCVPAGGCTCPGGFTCWRVPAQVIPPPNRILDTRY